ncbi:MAG: hypothetical protein QX189_03525, partial [Methylococcales bacterium]
CFSSVFLLEYSALLNIWLKGLVGFFEKEHRKLLANSLVIFVVLIPFFALNKVGGCVRTGHAESIFSEN